MPRIKKQGLDYFPLNTDFIHDRLVRRIMKREGDASLSVLIEVLSYIYSGEGYYVCADALFYEDLSSNLYEKTSDDIRRIVSLAVEYGIFDAALHAKYGILTSADIQRQYLFSTKRRNVSHLDPAYCLISEELLARPSGKNGAGNRSSQPRETVNSVNETSMESSVTADEQGGSDELEVNVNKAENGSFIPENVTSGTHSIAQNSIAEHSVAKNRKDSPSPSSPEAECGNTESGNPKGEEEKEKKKEEGRKEERRKIFSKRTRRRPFRPNVGNGPTKPSPNCNLPLMVSGETMMDYFTTCASTGYLLWNSTQSSEKATLGQSEDLSGKDFVRCATVVEKSRCRDGIC